MRYTFQVGIWLVGNLVVPSAFALPVSAVQDAHGLVTKSRSGRQEPQFVPLVSEATAPTKLRQMVTLDVNKWSLAHTLDEMVRQLGVPLIYDTLVTNYEQPITVKLENVSGARALLGVLRNTGLRVEVTEDGSAARVRGPKTSRATLPDGTTGVIVGQVRDAKTGQGIGNADVLLERSRWRTSTDTAGRYRLADVDTGTYTLMVRRPGYAKQSRSVTVREAQVDTVSLTLSPVAARLEELVTTATGRRRRLDIANDVTIINADSVMQTAPIRSVTELLENRVPGLTVQRTSGAPGDPARLRLRGVSSILRDNDPIVIVDGMRVYAQQSAARSGNLARRDTSGSGYTSAAPSPLDYLDPNSIETIEVLKGPSAATLYGQDAANGVIVITTKKGHAGPTRWTASAEHGRTQIEGDYPELLFRWGHESLHDGPVNCPLTNIAAGPFGASPCAGDSLRTFQLLNDPALTVLDRGNRTALSLGVSGGNQGLTYAVTGSYQDEIGLVKLPAYEAERYQSLLGLAPPEWMQRPQHLKQWGVTSTVGMRLGPQADVSFTTTFSRTEQQKSSLQDQLGTLMSTYLDQASGIYYQRQFNGGLTTADNALQQYFERATDHATAFTNGAAAQWRPRTWLTLDADAGLNVIQRTDQRYFPRGPANFEVSNTVAGDTTGYVADGQGTSIVSTVNLRANALAPLGRGFQFRLATGVNYAGTSTNDAGSGSSDLAPGTSLQGAKIEFLRRAEQSDATFGWYVEPSVGNSKLNFTSGLRLDGGSSYGGNVSGFKLPTFPKLGFSYLLSDETWFPFKNQIQSLRVRVAYGKASRQPGPTDRLRLYGIPTQILADSQIGTGVTLLTLGNTEVRPERSTEFEGGFDADLLDNRLTLSVSGYRKTTDDALLSVPVALSVYGENVSIIKNIGVVRNTGLEVQVGAQLVRSGPVTWQTQVQLSQARNVLVKLAPGLDPFYTGASGFLSSGIRTAPGYPLFGRWSRPILGYADANGNKVLEQEEIQLGDTAVYVGSTVPTHTASFSTTVSLWRGTVIVNASVSHEGGFAQRNETAQKLGIFSRGVQDPAASLAEQLAVANVDASFGDGTDYNWIQTVSTTRFNTLAVSYRVPAMLARRVGAQSVSIAVQGANLGLWTNYRGLDPHVNAFGTGNDVTDTGILPQPRTWQVKVNAIY